MGLSNVPILIFPFVLKAEQFDSFLCSSGAKGFNSAIGYIGNNIWLCLGQIEKANNEIVNDHYHSKLAVTNPFHCSFSVSGLLGHSSNFDIYIRMTIAWFSWI